MYLHPTRSTSHHADMSKSQTFQRFSITIVTAIQATVDDIASKCIAKNIVSGALRSKFVNGSGDKAQKAIQLVAAVIDMIDIDESKFDDFVEILAQDPSFKKLVCDLRCETSKTQQPGLSATDGPGKDSEDDYSSKPCNINPASRSSAEKQLFSPTAVEHADEKVHLVSAHSQRVKTLSKDADNVCVQTFAGVRSEVKVDWKVSDLEGQGRFKEK